MKKYIAFILIVFQCFTSLKSQCLDSDDKASNDAVNIKTPFGSTVNNFNWRDERYYFYLLNPVTNQSSLVDKLSPYFWLQGSPNITHLQAQPTLEKDFQPSDGWELVQYYFGQSVDAKKVPYLVLYNRLEGMLRVFCYVPAGFGYNYNAARIDLVLKKDPNSTQLLKNGMLAYSKMPANGLDKFDKNIVSSAPTFVDPSGNSWLYADFPIAYDPCTCNYPTFMNIVPVLMNISTIEETQEAIVSSGSTTTATNGSGILPIIDQLIPKIDAIEKKGAAVSKSLATGLNFIEKLLPITKVIETKSTFTEDDSPELAETMVSRSIKSSPIKFPDWAKSLPKIGYVIGLVELFTGGGKSQPTPSIAQARQRFKITGTQSTQFLLSPIDLYVPGSSWPSNTGLTLAKPYYNNTLGVFALVETPKIKYRGKYQQKSGPGYQYKTLGGQTVGSTTYNFVGWDFKLDDSNIKYAINPASGYKQVPKDIKASLIFNVRAKCTGSTVDVRYGAIPPFCTFNGPTTSSLRITRLGNSDTVTIQTPLMPLSCIKDYVAHLSFAGNTELKASDGSTYYSTAKFSEDVRIQIVAILEQENNPAKQHTFIAQYKLFPEQSSVDIPNTPISDIALNPVIENLTLTGNTTIRAWETVTFKGNINTNGFKLTVIAGKSIDIENPQQINNDMDLSIGLPTECQGTVPASSPKQLYSFCAKQGEKKYDPVAPAGPITEKEENASAVTTPLNNNNALQVTPNPFTNQFVLNYRIDKQAAVQITMFNSLGQVVRAIVSGNKEEGAYQTTENTSDLLPGVYFITLRTPQGIETKKLVKQ